MQDLRKVKNVVRILQIFETSKSVHLVMEYANNGTLLTHVRTNAPTPFHSICKAAKSSTQVQNHDNDFE